MLVVTRKVDEQIVIGEPSDPIAVVTIVRIIGDRVRIGIKSDPRVLVNRAEVAARIIENGTDRPVGCVLKPGGKHVDGASVVADNRQGSPGTGGIGSDRTTAQPSAIDRKSATESTSAGTTLGPRKAGETRRGT